MSEQAAPTGDSQPAPPKITIDLPKDLQAVYANVVLISHSPMELVLDFAQVLPRTPRGAVQSRVVMTPVHAKMLQMALAQNIANYERKFGEIRLPAQSPLADHFFRFSSPPESGDGPGGQSDS